MKKIILVMMVLMTFLNADVKSINVMELDELIHHGIKIIDIRMPNDVKQTGVIPTSYRLSFQEQHDEKKINEWLISFVRLVDEKGLKFVLVSSDGADAKHAARLLSDSKGYQKTYYLHGGINSWISSNKKLIQVK